MADELDQSDPKKMTPANREFVHGLGDLTLAFSQIEGLLKAAVTMLLTNPLSGKSDNVAYYAVTAKMPFQAVLEVFEALYRVRCWDNADMMSKLKPIMTAMRSHQEKRNGIVHSLWFPTAEPDVGRAMRFMLKGPVGLNVATRETEPGELHKLARSIRETGLELHGLMVRYERTNFPDRPPEEIQWGAPTDGGVPPPIAPPTPG